LSILKAIVTLLPDEGIAAAIPDPLILYSKTVKINGQSYRLALNKEDWTF
jgi:hypothetical protein